MNLTVTIAPVRKTLHVDLPQAQAFDLFAKGIDRWWPRTHHVGSSPMQAAILEPFTGGRWYHVCEDGSEGPIGHVLTWEPPERLMLSWEFDCNFSQTTETVTEVDVRFIAEDATRTRVEFEHRHLDRLGDRAEEFRGKFDNGWVTVLNSYVNEANAGR